MGYPKGRLGKLIRVFNRYIRLRDTDERGYGRCISCERTFHFKQLQAGHYWSVKDSYIRFNEKNINIQCTECNTFKEGNKPAYTINLVRKYGAEVLDELDTLRKQTVRNGYWKQDWLQEKIDYYTAKCEELEGKITD